MTVAALQPDTANAGCTFSVNMEPCASAAKPRSGRHAVRQANISKRRREEEKDRFECRAKRRGLIKWSRKGESAMGCRVVQTEDTRLKGHTSGLKVQSRPYLLQHLKLSACRPGALQLYSCRPLG